MIRIEKIYLEEFRGIRKLSLDLSGKNFAICGPNGTGKSGVVDAIEFCLTGDITRLSGTGTSGLTVKEHAPHVDQQKYPERAKVEMLVEIPSLRKKVTLTRSVKNPNKIQISPDTPEHRRVVEDLETHPEFALSRREIAKYIVTPPGERSKDVQTLLRLDHLEKLRTTLTKLNNKCLDQFKRDETAHRSAETDFRTGIGVEKLDRQLVLDKINEKRAVLRLLALTELTKDTLFLDGFSRDQPSDPRSATKQRTIVKKVALADMDALRVQIAGPVPTDLIEQTEFLKNALEQLEKDQQALRRARQQAFLKTGLDFTTDDSCPLCDTSWQREVLRSHIEGKLLSATETTQLLQKLDSAIAIVLAHLSGRAQALAKVVQYCETLSPVVDHSDMKAHVALLESINRALLDFKQDHLRVRDALGAVRKPWWTPEQKASAVIEKCRAEINKLPDATKEDEALQYLTVAQDRYLRLLTAAKHEKQSKSRKAATEALLVHYNRSCTAVLEGIFDKVSEDFSAYYRTINRDDEDSFVGKLNSAPAKLNFNVDFYGRGLFPPGAYHSEGHQDGMGLCLYLALMKHTLGNSFNFAVLDDVLMSVDTGHRREVCRLLKTQFPNTQFVPTTHDRVWLQYMRSEGLIERSQTFGYWNVDTGPRVWDDSDVWTEIESELSKQDVPKAAALLRRYLEYTASILANNLQAEVKFRGDGQYDLGDLLPPALKAWRDRLKTAEKAATKWKQDAKAQELQLMQTEAADLVKRTSVEQWAINRSVHFNEWANLTSKEFAVVTDAFKATLAKLRCTSAGCNSFLYISPSKGNAESLKCSCGAININLKDS